MRAPFPSTPDSGRSPLAAPLTRRTVLGGAAAGAAAIAVPGLPAWARVSSRDARALRPPDSLPFPHLPAGHPSIDAIDHIVVLMMENHSFDNLLGMVPHQVRGRRTVDGLTVSDGRVIDFNRTPRGRRVYANHATSPCQDSSDPTQTWNASHEAWDGGRNDGFVRASGPVAMWYWDRHDIPFTYSLAKHFPIGERYFCSVLAQTYPNRRFLFTGTASGLIATSATSFVTPAANGTIWDRLNDHGIDYAVYFQEAPSFLIVPNSGVTAARARHFTQFITDAAAGNLPQFTFIDPNYTTTSEENPQDIQLGEQFIAQVVRSLIEAPTWDKTALFITYDEHGGYYDHVPPPRAIKPDSIAPMLAPGDARGSYNRYGFRVPLIVVSPWARQAYSSRVVQDHTSITAFVERKWNLPAMTYRDANAHPMTDYFDFTRPAFGTPPPLAAAPALAPGLRECAADGLKPPLTG